MLIRLLHFHKPVSYTHLDVYKRQLLYHLCIYTGYTTGRCLHQQPFTDEYSVAEQRCAILKNKCDSYENCILLLTSED